MDRNDADCRSPPQGTYRLAPIAYSHLIVQRRPSLLTDTRLAPIASLYSHLIVQRRPSLLTDTRLAPIASLFSHLSILQRRPRCWLAPKASLLSSTDTATSPSLLARPESLSSLIYRYCNVALRCWLAPEAYLLPSIDTATSPFVARLAPIASLFSSVKPIQQRRSSLLCRHKRATDFGRHTERPIE
jgi:hypothetical protein